MDAIDTFFGQKAILFGLVLARVSGLMVTAPIYGTPEVPRQVRALVAFAVAMLLLPSQWHVSPPTPPNLPAYGLLVGGELLLGVFIGLGVTVLFTGIQLSGELIGRIGGLMVADVFDPGIDTSVPLLSRLMFLVALAVFLCLGGHRVVFGALLDTFAAVPPGRAGVPDSLTEGFVVLLSRSFALGMRAAAPVAAALLLATLLMGLIGRTLPQLNILIVGFGFNAMLTFGALMLTLGAAVWALQDMLAPGLETLLDALAVPLGAAKPPGHP